MKNNQSCNFDSFTFTFNKFLISPLSMNTQIKSILTNEEWLRMTTEKTVFQNQGENFIFILDH